MTATTIDFDVVGCCGVITLGTVTSSTAVQITTKGGDDSMTLNNEVYTVTTGDGADTVTITDSNTGSVVNFGDGNDRLIISNSNAVGTFAMGGDTDTVDDGARLQ